MTEHKTHSFIELHNVCYTYKNSNFSLENINLTIEGNGLTVLCGHNGSGKSTISKLIIGLLEPESGEIFIDGKNAAEMSLGEKGKKIGYLFQNPSQQIFAPEVKDELSFIPRLLGWNEAEIEKRCRELLHFFALQNLENSTTFFLSRGEKQRLALAGILFQNPPFLILDEPTTGLDEENRERLALLLHKLLDNGTGMILISHDTPFVERFTPFTRITVTDGRIS